MKESELPEGWEWKMLGDVCKKPEYGYTTSAKKEGDGPKFLRTTDITKDKFDWTNVPYCEQVPDDEEKYQLNDGDLLISRAGSVGAAFVVKKPPRAVFASYLIRFQPKENLNPFFADFFLKSNIFKNQLGGSTSGTTLQGVNASNLAKIKIPLPPLPIQRQIVAVLKQAEEVKRQRQEADALTGALLQSVFLKMFGDPVRNEKGWSQSKLGDCCRVQRGKFTYRPRNEPRFYGGNYPFIQTGDVANCQGKLKKYTQTLNDEGLSISKMFPKGTIVISIAANIGDTAILDFDSCFPDSVVGISPDISKGTVEFFEMMMRFYKEHLWNLAPETAQRNINLRILSELEVIIPPLALQQQFARVVQDVERIREQQVASGKEIEGLFEGLMQTAFRGESVA